MKGQVWQVWDAEGRRQYIDRDYASEHQAVSERTQLLLHFASYNPWRRRLVIRRPDGTMFNPEFDR